MIDFNKPLRVIDNPMSVIRDPDGRCRLFIIDGRHCVVADHGDIFRLELTMAFVENVPEKRVRYQAQFSGGHCGDWWSDKTNPMDITVTAWLIETDHGEGAAERYTYHREEISK